MSFFVSGQKPEDTFAMTDLLLQLETVANGEPTLELDELIKKSLADLALDDYSLGIDISSYIALIDSLLAGKESQKFSHLCVSEHQKILLLLLCRYADCQHPDDLERILRVLPHYMVYLLGNDGVVCGIISGELIDSLPHSTQQISHALKVRIHDFLSKNCKHEYTKKQEWGHLLNLLQQITDKPPFDLVDRVVKSLKAWKEDTSVDPRDFANVLRSFSGLVHKLYRRSRDPETLEDCLLKQDKETFDRFCKLNEDATYNYALFVDVVGYDAVLQKALDGECVDEHIDYLTSVLLNKAAITFDSFTPEEQQANVLLLLFCAQKTGDRKYLHPLLWILPYCLQHVDAVYSPKLLGERARSDAAYESALREVIKNFIDRPATDVASDPGCENFRKFLTFLPLNQDRDFSAEALVSWYNAVLVKPKPAELAKAITFFVEILSHSYLEPAEIEQHKCELLEAVYHRTGDGLLCLEALTSLFSDCQDEASQVRWLETTQGAVRRLFVDLVTHPGFPLRKKNSLVGYFLSKEATIASVTLAVRLMPGLSVRQVKLLAQHLKERDDPALVKLFIKSTLRISEEIRSQLATAFSDTDPFMVALANEVLENPTPLGIDFFACYVPTCNCTTPTRKLLYNLLLQPNAPSHYFVLATRMLRTSDSEFTQIADTLLKLMEQNPACLELEGFFRAVSEGKVATEVCSEIVIYLLGKNTPIAHSFLRKTHTSLEVKKQAQSGSRKKGSLLRQQLMRAHRIQKQPVMQEQASAAFVSPASEELKRPESTKPSEDQ